MRRVKKEKQPKPKEAKQPLATMPLLPWMLRDPIQEIENQFNRFFNFSLQRWPERKGGFLRGAWSPDVDVVDAKDSIHVRADIPGIKKEDLEVSIEGNNLIIKGEKKQESEIKEKDYFKSERFYGMFNRVVSLPSEVDSAKVQASYKDGVLELILPKKESAKPSSAKIEIK